MQAPYHTQPVQDAGSLRRQQVRFYLMVGGAGLLLIWFSIGRTPSTWTLWFQLVRQLHTFQVQAGARAFLALGLVSVQSLLLLGAWALLLYVIVHEGSRLHATTTKAAPAEQQAAPVLAPPPPDAALFRTLPTATIAASPAMPIIPIPPAPPVLPTAPAPVPPYQPERLEAQSTRLDSEQRPVASPFARKTHLMPLSAKEDDQEDFPTEPSRQAPVPSIEDVQASRNPFPPYNPPAFSPQQQALPAQPEFQAQQFAGNPEYTEKKREPASPSAQPALPEASKNDPYAVSSSIEGWEASKNDPYAVSSSIEKEQSSFPLWLVEGPKPNEDMAGGPFAAGKEALEAFQTTYRFPKPGPQQPAAAASSQDDGFVFGNPFDGPLPDVFEQDEALKRTITNLHSKPNQDQAPGKLSGGSAPGQLPGPHKQD
jgi:hypothetical protein